MSIRDLICSGLLVSALMSASYIHRDPLVLNPNTPQALSSIIGTSVGHNDYLSLSASDGLLGQGHRPYESRTIPAKSSPPTQTQVSLQSPKMSPDSTLTHLPSQSTSSVPRFPSPSTGFRATGTTVSPLYDGFLRSAISTDVSDRPCMVGSSTGIRDTVGSSVSVQPKSDQNRTISAQVGSLVRPRAMTASNTSRACTPNNTPSSSASIPSSTTPVKKSSRRNPWGPETYSDLISVAIHSYPDQQATLQQIYDFIITHYEYFRERSDPATSAGWKNSIRHNLSLHDRFTKCPKSSDNTKSSYWRINTEVASKPYVRRRACSMDNTNALKRPAGSMKAGNRGSSGVSRGSRTSTDKLTSRGSTTLNGSSSSTLCDPMQCAPNLTIGTADISPRFDIRTQQPARQYPKGGYGLPSKIPNYFQHATPMGKEQELQLPCNGNRWSNLKLSPPGGTVHYPYDQLSNNLLLDSEFNSMVGSTDHELVRNRASSLIENLLRSDHAGLDVGSSTVAHFSQTYLPNAPLSNTGLSLPWGAPPNQRSGAMDHSGSSLLSSVSQPHPLDMTPQSTQLRSLSPEPAADNMLHHNHLRPVRLQSTVTNVSSNNSSHVSESVDAMFGSSWQNYTTQFQFPISNAISNVSSVYPGFSGISPFPAVHSVSGHLPVDGFKPNYDVSSMDHHSTSSSVTSTNSMLPFFSSTSTNVVCTASLSPSASSSTSSSTRSWRHVLGLDGPIHGDQSTSQPDRGLSNAAGSSGSGLESRPTASISPSVPHYYSPMRTGLSGAFANPDCALDTPPYHQLKQESLENTDVGVDLGIRDRSIDCTKQTSPSENYNVNIASRSELCSALANRCYSEDFTYEEDDDRDKLELELSLELADRIVRSTKSENR